MQTKQILTNATKQSIKMTEEQVEKETVTQKEQEKAKSTDHLNGVKVVVKPKRPYAEPIITRSAGRDKLEIW